MKSPWLLSCLIGMLFVLSTRIEAREFVDSETTAGEVTRVTLYRGQALITRRIAIEGEKGSREIVVTDLPLSIVNTSLFAESTREIEVRAVRFRQRAVGEEPREEVRKIDEQLKELADAMTLNQKQSELLVQKLTYLDQLQNFVAPTSQTELTKGVLNAETLERLTEFAFSQRTAIVESQVRMASELAELQKKVELLQRQRNEVAAQSQRTVYEAVLFLEKTGDGKQAIELNYLVGNCGWSPTYAIRGTTGSDNAQVDYNAMIQQMTGENWEGVQLTLSTASPALSASGPSLAPFSVALGSGNGTAGGPAGDQAQLQQQLARAFSTNRAAQMELNERLNNTYDFQAKTDSNWSLNILACDTQSLELVNPFNVLSTTLSDIDMNNAPSMSYQLPNSVSLANRNDQQMVRIFRGELKTQFYYVATPLLSSYVYREAEIDNESEIDFLDGVVTVYLDNRFVGRAEIPTVAQGETFVLGFGSDAQVRARRDLVSKEESIQGGNKELKLEYRLLVENYKSQAIPIRVYDRMPYSNQSADIRVTLTTPSPELSQDATYLRRERSKNILRWDVEVPSDAAGEKALEITYGYTVDYDRNFAITDASDVGGEIDQFKQLERLRQKR